MVPHWQKLLTKTSRSHIKRTTKILAYSGAAFLGFGVAHQVTVQSPSSTGKSDFIGVSSAAIRFLRSITIATTISIDYYTSKLYIKANDPSYDSRMSTVHTRNAERILKGCLINGGTYIKIGQGLISLSHILPKEYIAILTQLQDKCLVRSIEEVRELFVEDFGKEPENVFGTFNSEPIAAASLAQVFVAVTKDGKKVAVKVQYNDLRNRFESDVKTINFLLKVGGLIHPTFDFAWILEDLVESLREELDFNNEGKNSERCADDLKHLSFVHVPKVFWDLSSDRVLVTEYVDGIKVNNTNELIKAGHLISDIDRKMFRAFGEQIFQTGFVHADPHPGNILVRKHNKETQLVLLDHGLYQKMSNETLVALSNFWQALVLKNPQAMQQYSRQLGVEDYRELAEILTQRPMTKDFKLVTRLTAKDLAYFQELASNRLDIITGTLRQMPRSLLLVVRNLNTLRAISHEHGDPVDRFTLLARLATKSAFRNSKLTFVTTRLHFEYNLFKGRLWMWFLTFYFNFLQVIGRSPDASTILSQIN